MLPAAVLALPGVSKALGFVKYLPYLAIVGLGLAVAWYMWDAQVAKAERDKALVEKRIAEEKNVTLLSAIASLEEWRQTTSKLYAELNASITALVEDRGNTDKELDDAGQDDEARTWFDTPIPAAVQRVLNKRVPAQGSGNGLPVRRGN